MIPKPDRYRWWKENGPRFGYVYDGCGDDGENSVPCEYPWYMVSFWRNRIRLSWLGPLYPTYRQITREMKGKRC
jgi:hypothetical protein